MACYLIEFRVRGYAKRYAKRTIYEISKKFRVNGMSRNGAVPHITLYGPFTTNNERSVITSLLNACKKYNRIYFSFKGFNHFNNPKNKVIYLDISPSEDLKNFRYELASNLRSITSTISREDRKSRNDFMFHSTIAFKDIDKKFNDIWGYINNKQKPNIRQTLLRVTILKNARILYEYDFLQKRLLNRRQSLSKGVFRETINILKQKPSHENKINPIATKPIATTFLGRIISLFKGEK